MTETEEGGGDEVMRMMREQGVLIRSECKPWKPGRTIWP